MEEAETRIVDFEKICRLCLDEKRVLMEIFQSSMDNNNLTIDQKIMACAAVDLYKNDGLPAKICIKCLSNVNAAFDFRIQCENADRTLHDFRKLSIINQIKLEPEEKEKITYDKELEEFGKKESAVVKKSIKVGHVVIINKNVKKTGRKGPFESFNGVNDSDKKLKYAERQFSEVLISDSQKEGPSAESSDPVVEGERPTNLEETPTTKLSFTLQGASQDTYRLIMNSSEGEGTGVGKAKDGKKGTGDTGKSSCPFCNKMLTRVEEHVRLLHRNKVYVCTKLDCGAKFLTLKNLQSHQLRCYDVEKAYKCFRCFKEFHRKSNYKAHVRRHSDVKGFQCQLCDRAFVDSTGLRRHFLKHHEPRQETFVSGCCGKKFKSKEGLKKHIQKGICGIQMFPIPNSTNDDDSTEDNVLRTCEEQMGLNDVLITT